MTQTTLEAADINFILKTLPHRFPFLLIDRVHSIRGDEFAVGVKNVTANEPQFMGHFPERSGVPGHLHDRGHGADRGRHLHLLGQGADHRNADGVFHDHRQSQVPQAGDPGDTIEYHMTKIAQRRNMWWYRGEAQCRRYAGRRGRSQRHARR